MAISLTADASRTVIRGIQKLSVPHAVGQPKTVIANAQKLRF